MMGLIAGALTGAAKGVGEIAQMGIEKQNKIDLAQAFADIDQQKQLRIDEVTRGRNIEDIGRKAEADAAAAPIVAKGKVAGQVAELQAQKTSGVAQLQAELDRAKFDASKSLERDKAVATNENAAAGQVAKTKVPGYLQSLEKEDYAKSAGERSVAGISATAAANAPKITALADGSMAVVTGGKITSYLTDPKTGEKVYGPKDLDSRTSAMVNALLLDAKTDLDPESRRATVEQAISILQGAKANANAPTAKPGQYNEGDIVNLTGGGRGQVVKAPDGTLKVKPLK